ncbi:hypothetical protein QBC38DRAFT_485937 [Podospora fimiseda]|uniref:Glyoxalase/fosfomycin resistance/dioxygenase domain-containing protein n=1 Tax=Podospora fimiseda TaxID=252190 RepID=A0AAN7BJ55_9PEZI|nr:hypothetical protein QBC38DRAFT_485937 [Podospora fimiseda]
MASEESTAKGQMCWVEIPCADIPRAISFYRNVLAWDTPDAGTPDATIPAQNPGNAALHTFKTGHLQGAFIKMCDPSYVAKVADPIEPFKSSILPYYSVVDINETLAKVEKYGGKVHVPKTAIFDGKMGWFARFIDSEGNLQGIWAQNDSPNPS